VTQLVSLQAPILCEIAAFVASCCKGGEQVSKAYCDLAECWATELEGERITSQQAATHASPDESGHQRQCELKAKIIMCHYLVVIACGCSAAPGTIPLRSLDQYACKLCNHMLLVCLHSPLISDMFSVNVTLGLKVSLFCITVSTCAPQECARNAGRWLYIHMFLTCSSLKIATWSFTVSHRDSGVQVRSSERPWRSFGAHDSCQASSRACHGGCHHHTLHMRCQQHTPSHWCFKTVFTEAPAALHWQPCSDATGCWVAESRGISLKLQNFFCSNSIATDVYTVNLLTGAALRNGQAPFHLPLEIVNHEVYQIIFQKATFDVTSKTLGGQATYRTVHAINGCYYSWRLDGSRLHITETCNEETLELLPCALQHLLDVAPVIVAAVYCVRVHLDLDRLWVWSIVPAPVIDIRSGALQWTTSGAMACP
jgi:hypothetical protein